MAEKVIELEHLQKIIPGFGIVEGHKAVDKAEKEHEHQRDQEIGHRPGQRSQGHALFRISEIIHIHRHRLCPADVKHHQHQKAHHVQMLEGIEGEPAPRFGSVVAQTIGCIAMAQLMEGDAQQ